MGPKLKDNYAHAKLDPTKHNQGVVIMLHGTMKFISELIRMSLSLFILCALDIMTKSYSLFFIIPRKKERKQELIFFLFLTTDMQCPSTKPCTCPHGGVELA